MESAGPPVLLGILSLVCLLLAIRSLRRRRLHVNVPTSKTKGVFLGLNEVKGASRSAEPLRSRLAAQPCVWFAWTVEEQWERQVTRTDAEGKTTTETERGWSEVAKGGASMPFELEDETGRIRVAPDGAQIEGVQAFQEECGPADRLYYDHGPAESVAGSVDRRRLVETILPIDVDLYVIGTARMRADIVEPEIAGSDTGELFLISTRSEQQIVSGHFWGIVAATIIGAALAVGAGWTLAKTEGAVIGAGIFLGVLAVVWIVLVYNGLVSVRQRVEMAEAMLDVQLKRRHVLIPRLQSCVAAIAGHEESVLETVAGLRAQGRLVALVEKYPDLKTNENFLQLQDELIDTEDRIALARAFVNNSVTAHNLRVETMPAAIVAKLTGFHRRELLSAP
ncbi:MAG: LemA family protein [Planctomycetota bacterium]|jgi:hypothetical protein